MRRSVFAVLVVAALALGAVSWAGRAGVVAAQQIATNTPAPTDVVFATNTPVPTDVVFATNTPGIPSATATLTAAPTLTPSPTATFTVTPSPTPIPIGPRVYPDGINSLTGLPYPDETAQNRRNLLVKISNYPPVVRPQSGLNQADVIFEYEVEGGVTRFAALFRSAAPTHVGPVRSGRLVDLELAPMYNALWAYSGSSEPIMNIVLNGELTPWGYNIFSPQFGDNCEDAGFCRFPRDGVAFEHTLYLDTSVLWAKADRRGVNRPERARGFAFGADVPPGGAPALDVLIPWWSTEVRWQYDAAQGRYLRWTDGLPHLDAAEGQQIWVNNLVIIQAEHRERPDLFELESRSASLEIALWNEADGYYPALVFRDGVYFQGYWERRDREMGSALELRYANGEPIPLHPGRTWVSIVRWTAEVQVGAAYADMNATGTAIAPTPAAPLATAAP